MPDVLKTLVRRLCLPGGLLAKRRSDVEGEILFWPALALAAALAVVVTFLAWTLRNSFSDFHFFFVYIPPIAAAAYFAGRITGITLALLSFIFAWFFLVPPPDSFSLSRGAELPLVMFGVVALGTALAGSHFREVERQRRQMEARLFEAERTARAQAEAAQRLQKTLLDSIAHDLGTPLTSVTGVLSALVTDWGRLAPGDQHELLNIAHDEAKRLGRLVAGLLELTRLEARALQVRREFGKIEDILGEACAQLHEKLDGRPVQVSVPAGFPPIPMDPALLVLVFTNLIDNAVKFSPDATPIMVEAAVDDGSATIRVADRGAGIPSGDLERVFDKFYRVRRTANAQETIRGTGIGLAIAKGIIEAHDGRIWAESREGGGTVFCVGLPLE